MNKIISKKKSLVNIFILVFTSFIILPTIFSPVFAQANTTAPIENPFSNLANLSGAGICEENGLHSIYTESNVFEKSGSIQSLMYTGLSMIGGCYATDPNAPSTGMVPQVTGGLLSSLSGVTGAIYEERPVSLAWQIDQTIQNISPNKETLAASYLSGLPTGISILSIISQIHGSMLNIVMLFYILIFLLIGGAMIFRSKIGGQEYVTIVNSIPRVIVSLILVVFSLPISGLIIDLGNVGYSLVYNIFVNEVKLAPDANSKLKSPGTLGNSTDPAIIGKNGILQQLLPTNPEMSIWRVFGLSGIDVLSGNGPSGTINLVETNLTGPNGGSQFTGLITWATNAIKTFGGGVVGNSQVGGLLVFVMTLGAAFAMFKTFFALIKDYLIMLFYPIFAPFQFAMYALPGQDKQIVNYIKTLLGAVLSFVGVYAVFVLIVFLGQHYLIDTVDANGAALTLAANPPLLGFNGAVSIQLVVSLAGYGLFLLAPTVPDMVKNALGTGAGSFSKFTSQIGESTKSAVRRIPIVGSFV